jgi:ureidoglycolate hydrolase
MPVGTPPGDLALIARPATVQNFEPYGKLLAPGDRLRLGKKGPVNLAVEDGKPGPRRVTHLVRYPVARRVVFPLASVPLLVLVLPPGEHPSGPPVAFQTGAGVGVLIEAGVWHHGPVPVGDVRLVEVVETPGPADRVDRRALRDLVGSEAARIALPEEPDAPPKPTAGR